MQFKEEDGGRRCRTFNPADFRHFQVAADTIIGICAFSRESQDICRPLRQCGIGLTAKSTATFSAL